MTCFSFNFRPKAKKDNTYIVVLILNPNRRLPPVPSPARSTRSSTRSCDVDVDVREVRECIKWVLWLFLQWIEYKCAIIRNIGSMEQCLSHIQFWYFLQNSGCWRPSIRRSLWLEWARLWKPRSRNADIICTILMISFMQNVQFKFVSHVIVLKYNT